MSYITDGTVWPEFDINNATKALLVRFFELADLKAPEAGKLMAAEIFTSDAVLSQGKRRICGSQGTLYQTSL